MAEAAPIISVRNARKHFGPVAAVDGVSLEIGVNEFFALLGPSGCGKTTLLRLLAGFEIPDGGEILIDGEDMAGVPPNRRPVNMVFQSYAVFPHMTVFDNVAYGLRVAGTPAAEVAGRVETALRMTRLPELAGRRPDQLSGGQRQRVALARALVKRPKVLLLDEPLSALDAKLREAMRLELVRLQGTVGITFVIVTHDQGEALSMADRIAVMEDGRVRQVARPMELYEFPNCRFVAEFIGKMNLFSGRIVSGQDGQVVVEVPDLGRLRLPAGDGSFRRTAGGDGEVGVAVRPEKVRIGPEPGPEGRINVHGRIREIAYYGDTSHVYLALDGGRTIDAHVRNDVRSTTPSAAIGDELWCSWDAKDMLLLAD